MWRCARVEVCMCGVCGSVHVWSVWRCACVEVCMCRGVNVWRCVVCVWRCVWCACVEVCTIVALSLLSFSAGLGLRQDCTWSWTSAGAPAHRSMLHGSYSDYHGNNRT